MPYLQSSEPSKGLLETAPHIQTAQTENAVSQAWSRVLCAAPPQPPGVGSVLVVSSVSPYLRTLGRPLWIQPKEQRKAALDPFLFSSIVMYNLGLSFNLMANRLGHNEHATV